MTSVLECIEAGTRYLEKRQVDDARRNMQLMVAHVLGCSRMDLYVQFDRPLSEAELMPLREGLRLRGERVPLQHILGEVEFHRRLFRCDKRALIPRPETEELVELLLRRCVTIPHQVLDVGCGSGVLGLSLAAEWATAEVTLIDVSRDALDLAAENASRLGLERVRFLQSDLVADVDGAYDLVVANLPYIPTAEAVALSPEVRHDPALALFGGADGLELIRRLIATVAAKMNEDSWLVLEIGYDQAQATRQLLEQAGFVDIEVVSDLSGVERFPLARKGKISTDA